MGKSLEQLTFAVFVMRTAKIAPSRLVTTVRELDPQVRATASGKTDENVIPINNF